MKLNASGYDAIHITRIETSFECDTFIPTFGTSTFHPCRRGGDPTERDDDHDSPEGDDDDSEYEGDSTDIQMLEAIFTRMKMTVQEFIGKSG